MPTRKQLEELHQIDSSFDDPDQQQISQLNQNYQALQQAFNQQAKELTKLAKKVSSLQQLVATLQQRPVKKVKEEVVASPKYLSQQVATAVQNYLQSKQAQKMYLDKLNQTYQDAKMNGAFKDDKEKRLERDLKGEKEIFHQNYELLNDIDDRIKHLKIAKIFVCVLIFLIPVAFVLLMMFK